MVSAQIFKTSLKLLFLRHVLQFNYLLVSEEFAFVNTLNTNIWSLFVLLYDFKIFEDPRVQKIPFHWENRRKKTFIFTIETLEPNMYNVHIAFCSLQ